MNNLGKISPRKAQKGLAQYMGVEHREPSQAGRPEQKQSLETGEGTWGIRQPEQQPKGGGVNSPEFDPHTGQREPQKAGADSNPPIEIVRLAEVRPAMFDCVVPRIIFDLVMIHKRLVREDISEEQAQLLGQQWREHVKTKETQGLQEELRAWEKTLQKNKRLEQKGKLTTAKQALIPVEEEQVAALREELRRRAHA